MTSKEDFQTELTEQILAAKNQGESYIDINSGELHRKVGGYPAKNHKMPTCCNVMYQQASKNDQILSSPPKGRGASLTIRYIL